MVRYNHQGRNPSRERKKENKKSILPLQKRNPSRNIRLHHRRQRRQNQRDDLGQRGRPRCDLPHRKQQTHRLLQTLWQTGIPRRNRRIRRKRKWKKQAMLKVER